VNHEPPHPELNLESILESSHPQLPPNATVVRETATGVEIEIRVIPRARRTEISGHRDGAVLIRVAAPPVEDAANDALTAFLAGALSVPRRSVRLVRGAHSRTKTVAVAGVSARFVHDRLRGASGGRRSKEND
jgi:uncharacterized protein